MEFGTFIFLLFLSRALSQVVNFTYIEDVVAKGAVCLDGSPATYYYDKGFADGVNNWLVYLPGGGWCNSVDDCLNRSKLFFYGSSNNATTRSFDTILSSDRGVNPDFYSWNRIVIQYCDGASFMADVEAVDPKTNLHLRGGRIFNSTMEELLAKGMRNATNAILVGDSAGGLATILNCDRFHEFLPYIHTVKCISDSGFFIRGKMLPGVEGREGLYASVVAFHELAKRLPTSCTSRIDPSLCLFAEYLVGDIQTPLFLLNSAFDRYQIRYNLSPYPSDEPGWKSCIFDLTNCTHSQLQHIKDFRFTFLDTLKEVRDIPSRGLFINSCYIHDFIYMKGNWLRIPTINNTGLNFTAQPTLCFGCRCRQRLQPVRFSRRSIIKRRGCGEKFGRKSPISISYNRSSRKLRKRAYFVSNSSGVPSWMQKRE